MLVRHTLIVPALAVLATLVSGSTTLTSIRTYLWSGRACNEDNPLSADVLTYSVANRCWSIESAGNPGIPDGDFSSQQVCLAGAPFTEVFLADSCDGVPAARSAADQCAVGFSAECVSVPVSGATGVVTERVYVTSTDEPSCGSERAVASDTTFSGCIPYDVGGGAGSGGAKATCAGGAVHLELFRSTLCTGSPFLGAVLPQETCTWIAAGGGMYTAGEFLCGPLSPSTTPTPTRSPSTSLTPSQSRPPSSSPSTSATRSRTITPSESQSRPPPGSPTSSTSKSQTRTPSPSLSASRSRTSSRTPSSTRTPSISRSASPSVSRTSSPSRSRTPTPSSSAPPCNADAASACSGHGSCTSNGCNCNVGYIGSRCARSNPTDPCIDNGGCPVNSVCVGEARCDCLPSFSPDVNGTCVQSAFHWETTVWSACSLTCNGAETRSRVVSCWSSSPRGPATDSDCDSATKPSASQTCPDLPCISSSAVLTLRLGFDVQEYGDSLGDAVEAVFHNIVFELADLLLTSSSRFVFIAFDTQTSRMTIQLNKAGVRVTDAVIAPIDNVVGETRQLSSAGTDSESDALMMTTATAVRCFRNKLFVSMLASAPSAISKVNAADSEASRLALDPECAHVPPPSAPTLARSLQTTTLTSEAQLLLDYIFQANSGTLVSSEFTWIFRLHDASVTVGSTAKPLKRVKTVSLTLVFGIAGGFIALVCCVSGVWKLCLVCHEKKRRAARQAAKTSASATATHDWGVTTTSTINPISRSQHGFQPQQHPQQPHPVYQPQSAHQLYPGAPGQAYPPRV